MKYLLTSISPLKQDAIRDVISEWDKSAEFHSQSINEGLPPQPYGNGFVFAAERMMRLRRNNLELFRTFDFVISIESYIKGTKNDMGTTSIEDHVAVIILCGQSGNMYYSSKLSCLVPSLVMEEVYPDFGEPGARKDLYVCEGFSGRGFSTTFGDYLVDRYPEENIDPKNWHLRYGIDRRCSMRAAVKEAFLQLFESKDENALRSALAVHANYPKEGITYVDINSLLSSEVHFQNLVSLMGNRYDWIGIDYVIGLESRGFILAGALAVVLGTGVLMIRKKGKLPGKIITESYVKEYGVDEFEIPDKDYRVGIARANPRCIIVDDIIATGGSMGAAVSLARKCGLEVEDCCAMYKIGNKNIKDYSFPLTVLLEPNQNQ